MQLSISSFPLKNGAELEWFQAIKVFCTKEKFIREKFI
jgi:hypothetical protein